MSMFIKYLLRNKRFQATKEKKKMLQFSKRQNILEGNYAFFFFFEIYCYD